MKTITLFLLLMLATAALAQQNPVNDQKPIVIPIKNNKPVLGGNTGITGGVKPERLPEDVKFDYNGDEVWLFSDANYKGEKKVLPIGIKKSYTLNELGFQWNDKVSSILVPKKGNMYFYFFKDDNFQGEYLSILNSVAEHTGKFPDLATLEEDPAYTAATIQKPESWRKNANGTFTITFNDQISSIKFELIH